MNKNYEYSEQTIRIREKYELPGREFSPCEQQRIEGKYLLLH